MYFLLYLTTIGVLLLGTAIMPVPLVVALCIGLFLLSVYLTKEKESPLTRTFLTGVCIVAASFLLGIYLGSYVKLLKPIFSILGTLASLPIMVIAYFVFAGRTRKAYVVKKSKIEEKITLKARFKLLKEKVSIIRTLWKTTKLYKDKGHSLVFSFQLAYVELDRKAVFKAPKNSIDFKTVIKEVAFERNEYDEYTGKKRII